MKLHAFLETNSRDKQWDFTQAGIFPAREERRKDCINWHQPFDFEEPLLAEVIFSVFPNSIKEGMPQNISMEVQKLRSFYYDVVKEGWVTIADLLAMAEGVKDHWNMSLRSKIPEDSLFWRDLNLMRSFGMLHRVRIVMWTTGIDVANAWPWPKEKE